MGVVYLACDDRLRRRVAVKMIAADAAPGRIARFRREAGLMAGLRHPNVVQVFEIGEHGGRPYFVMEYVPGGTLADRLATAPLLPADAARVVEQSARAVHAAHERGIVHRDLKPSNILLASDESPVTSDEASTASDLVARHPSPATPKVADFGLAREESSGSHYRTETGAVLGTPGYMAPEQLGGAAGGPALDVYSLGAVLYECLTGRPPLSAATPLEALEQLRTRDPVPPRQFRPAVPRDLETICLKCLQRDPRKRYESAVALADDLARFQNGRPILARPAGPVERAVKWARRKPTVAALTGACVVSVAALAAVVSVYTARLREAARQADANATEARRQQGLATANYRAARDALRRMIARLDNRPRGDLTRLTELQHAQLEDALAFYQVVLGGLEDPDPEVQLDAAVALVEVGSAQFRLGQTGPAEGSLRRAVAGLKRLPDPGPARPEYRNALAQAYYHLAALANAAGRPGEAEAYLRDALAESEELLHADPDDSTRQAGVARAEHNLGEHYFRFQRRDLAEACDLRAVAILTRLRDRHPDSEVYQWDLAATLTNLGLLHLQANRLDDAGVTFRQTEGLLGPLHAAHPRNNEYAQGLAGLYVNWANLLRLRDDLSAALAKADRAVELAEAAHRREPHDALLRERVVEARGTRSVVLGVMGRHADALVDWERVVEVADEPQRTQLRVGLAVRLSYVGLHHRAAAEAHALAQVSGLPDEELFQLACVLGRAVAPARADPGLGALAAIAAAEAHASAALGLLRRAHAAGYFRQPIAALWLRTDFSLVSLRDRADFRKLLVDVDADSKRPPPNPTPPPARRDLPEGATDATQAADVLAAVAQDPPGGAATPGGRTP
jgi:tetratricopeptide (TPR) repeat protein